MKCSFIKEFYYISRIPDQQTPNACRLFQTFLLSEMQSISVNNMYVFASSKLQMFGELSKSCFVCVCSRQLWKVYPVRLTFVSVDKWTVSGHHLRFSEVSITRLDIIAVSSEMIMVLCKMLIVQERGCFLKCGLWLAKVSLRRKKNLPRNLKLLGNFQQRTCTEDCIDARKSFKTAMIFLLI